MKSFFVWCTSVALACLSTLDASAGTLDQIKARGELVCGSGSGIPGFGLLDSGGGGA